MLELTAVIAILGLLASVAMLRWGGSALTAASTEGFVRSVSLSLGLARRQAIAEGTPAAVLLARTGGAVSSIQVVRVDGADTPTDAAIAVPDGATVTTTADRWEYDFTGTLVAPAAGGSLTIVDGVWTYTLTVNPATGHVQIAKSP